MASGKFLRHLLKNITPVPAALHGAQEQAAPNALLPIFNSLGVFPP